MGLELMNRGLTPYAPSITTTTRQIKNPGTFLRTDGKPVRGNIWEVVLKKR